MSTTMAARPLRLQDMLKTAMAESARRVSITAEAARQMGDLDTEKTASEDIPTSAVSSEYALKLASALEYLAVEFEKDASEHVGPGQGAGALEVLQAESSQALPDSLGHGHNTVPMHTGMQGASAHDAHTQVPNNADKAPGGRGTQTTAMSGGKGKTAFAVTPEGHKLDAKDYRAIARAYGAMDTAREEYTRAAPIKASLLATPLDALNLRLAARHLEHAAKKHEKGENAYNPFGGLLTPAEHERHGKTAGVLRAVFNKLAKEDAKLEDEESEGMAEARKGLARAEAAHAQEKKGSFVNAARAAQMKLAEDAINPAHITAGPAVPPEASASGEPGGAPAGGMPQGPRHLVGSNDSAINYKRNQAYAGRKSELSQYFNEPALSMSTDKTLAAAFDSTAQAGTKFASANGGSTKVAAARAILAKLAEEAEARSAKNPSEREAVTGSGQ